MRQQSVIDSSIISIIVPIYNVEKYLSQCLSSILAQTYTNWECILVDDSSPDNSVAICADYVARDGRFKLLRRPNGGVSTARNAGLEIARGNYIYFVDPDDYLEPRTIERMISVMKEYDADVVETGYDRVYTHFSKPRHLVSGATVFNQEEIAMCMLAERAIPCYMWNKLFKREVINTPFPVNHTFEDMYVMSFWVKDMHKMVIIPDILYNYRQRAQSIMHSDYANNRLQYLESTIKLANALETINPNINKAGISNIFIWKGIVNAGKDISRGETKETARAKSIARVSEKAQQYPLPPFSKVKTKLWLRCYLLKHYPGIFSHVIRFTGKIDFYRQRLNRNMFK